MSIHKTFLLCFFIILASGCSQKSRLGMVMSEDGNMYGSAIEKNIVLDPYLFYSNKIKLSIRNTSGDPSLDLRSLETKLAAELTSKGYDVVQKNSREFHIKYDINVTYSGYIKTDMRSELGFLGLAAGGIAGNNSNLKSGTAIGLVSGATLGAILGSYVSEDTYMTVTDVTIAVKKPNSGITKRSITFNSSPSKQEEERSGITRFEETFSNRVAVYAGGRNTSQKEVITEVRSRILRILSDLI